MKQRNCPLWTSLFQCLVNPAPGIISRTDAVRSVMSKIGAAAYAAAAAAASTTPVEEQVIDGEATEVATDPDSRPA